MALLSFTSNAKEYEARCQKDFTPPNLSLKELRDAVPKAVFEKNTAKGVYYVVRCVVMAFACFKLAEYIDPFAALLSAHPVLAFGVRWSLWATYWFVQGVIWCGLWTLGACARSIYACSSQTSS
jgi:hypothetical protein